MVVKAPIWIIWFSLGSEYAITPNSLIISVISYQRVKRGKDACAVLGAPGWPEKLLVLNSRLIDTRLATPL